jgi:hypothetical protein
METVSQHDGGDRVRPAGMLSPDEAAAVLGVGVSTWCAWEAAGKVPPAQWVALPRGGRAKLYPAEAVERMGREQAAAAFPPAGTVDGDVAAAMLGISGRTFSTWVRAGRVTGGQAISVPGRPGRQKVYAVADLQRLRARIDGQYDPYPDPDRPGVFKVPIASGKHPGMAAVVDAADLPLVAGKQWNWSPGHTGKGNGGSVVLRMTGSPKPSLSRVLLGVTDPTMLVSHLNGDRLDCRRENLVVRTRQQVRRAARKMTVKAGKACGSRFKGVQRTESGRKWSAAIAIDGKYRNLGRFRSEVDAALAYDAALRELMGPDVVGLNLPDPAEADRLRALEPQAAADAAWPPPGMVDRHEACAMFGVAISAWMRWEKIGRITCGRFFPLPDDTRGGRCKLYPRDGLERARAEIEQLGKPYPDPGRPGVWRVPLKGYVAYREALVDEADLPVVAGRNWNWSERTDGRVEGTVVLATTARQEPLHRLIAGVTDPAVRVGFVNGDALDCRRANLAARTLAETSHASRKIATRAGKECTSRFKGVYHDAGRARWVAQIRKGSVYQHVGRFHDESRAAQAYDDCARVLFGPHAYVNFPDRASSEQDRLWAQRVLDGTAEKERRRRRRLKALERRLKRVVREARRGVVAGSPVDGGPPAGTDAAVPTIGRRVSRKLFGVTRRTWRRWRRFGWLPQAVKADGKRTAYPLADVERLLRACGRTVLPYPDPERPGTYRVPLGGRTARGREALVDADALPLVRARRWRFAPAPQGRGGEVQTMNPAENVRLHQVVMGITGGEAGHVQIGFRNDDPLDCRRANLVLRTLTDTAGNRRKQATFSGRPCTSRFKGVFFDRRRKHWVATIKKDRVQHRLGTFRDELAAAQAYDEAARALFGEHARPNFPDGVAARLDREAAAADDGDPAAGADAEPTEPVEPTEPARWRRTALDLVVLDPAA